MFISNAKQTLTSLDIQANYLGIKGIMQTVPVLTTNKVSFYEISHVLIYFPHFCVIDHHIN